MRREDVRVGKQLTEIIMRLQLKNEDLLKLKAKEEDIMNKFNF